MNKITESRSKAIVLLVRYNQPDERLFAEISSALADLLFYYTLSKIGFSQCQA